MNDTNKEKENDMAGYLNEEVQKWYKENKDLIGVIETLTKRCKELEKKADLSNAAATHWQHNFFVESARYDELIDKASELNLENAKLQITVNKLKDEVRKLNAACQAKSVKIESLKKKLANKGIRIANNVIDPYCEVSYVFDNGYYRVDEILEVHTNETD